MSKRAEQAALRRYALKEITSENVKLHDEFQLGYELAEKDLDWRSVDESLPEIGEEVIVLTDELGTTPIYKIAFGHIVDRRYAMDYNGWNVPGVKFWRTALLEQVEK